jgi:hypothetical protein
LTILAVAKGRFPISISSPTKLKVSSAGGQDSKQGNDDEEVGDGDEDSASDNDGDGEPMVIAGPGGYWAMIKAICDDEPPKAGKRFSSKFNRFIALCLQKDANDRWSARQLLEENPFVLSYHQQQIQRQQSRHLLLSQQNSQRNVLISNPVLQAESDKKEQSPPQLYYSVVEEKLSIMDSDVNAGRQRKDSDNDAKSTHSNPTNSNKSLSSYHLPDDFGPTSSSRESSARTQRSSALKARLTSVTLAKNNVDVSTPSNSSNKGHHNFNSNTNNNNISNSGGNNNKEDNNSVHSAHSSTYLPSSPTPLPLVTTTSTASPSTNSTPQTDLNPNRHYRNEIGGPGQEARNFDFNINWADPSIWEILGDLGNLGNLERLGASLGTEMLEKDMDDLGLGTEELSAIYAIRFEHLGTVLQKIAQKLQLTSPEASSAEQVADIGESTSLDEVTKHQHEKLLHVQEDESMHQLNVEEEEELFQLAAPPPRYAKNNPQNSMHNKSTNRAVLALTQDDGDNDDARPPISPRLDDNLSGCALPHNHISHHPPHFNTMNLTNNAANSSVAAPMQKQKSILKSRSNSNSLHNVHFSAAEESPADSAPANNNNNYKEGGLRQRLQLKTLSLQVDDDITTSSKATEGGVSETAAEATEEGIANLPRPSSYFIRSSQSKDEDDTLYHANGSSHQHLQYVSNSKNEKTRMAEAYRQMLPKVDMAQGLAKWRHLATQLHLPVPVVVLAAQAYLGSLVRNAASP